MQLPVASRDDTFDVRPGSGIGPINIGMTRADAVDAAERAALTAAPFTRGTRPALVIDRDLFAYLDGDDRVEEVEVAINSDRAVIWDGIDFALDPAIVAAALDEIAEPDRTHPDYPSSIDYGDLGHPCGRTPNRRTGSMVPSNWF